MCHRPEVKMDKSDEKKVERINPEAVEHRMKQHSSRRSFLKKALVSTVAVTATASLAKKASDLLVEPDHEKAAANEILAGDRTLRAREYVVMSNMEKREYLAALLENSKKDN